MLSTLMRVKTFDTEKCNNGLLCKYLLNFREGNGTTSTLGKSMDGGAWAHSPGVNEVGHN